MVNIIDGDIWNAEPAMRPEDEILLKKLHDMLQSTAEDLKLLSGELTKYREPGVQVKSLPTPLDEEFNEKVHIEEIVNAKFNGYKVIDKSSQTAPANTQKDAISGLIKAIATDIHNKPKKVMNTGMQVNQVPTNRKPSKKSNLAISRTNIVHVKENFTNTINGNTNNSKQQEEKLKSPAVAYNEFSFKYVEPKMKMLYQKPLQIQNMPCINIRSELKEQKVLNLNIDPEVNVSDENIVTKSNVGVISIHHEPIVHQQSVPTIDRNQVQYSKVPYATSSQEPTRKVSKMSSCESSESTNNVRIHALRKIKPYKDGKVVRMPSKSRTESVVNKRNVGFKKDCVKPANYVLDDWRKKLNTVYGGPSSSRKVKPAKNQHKVKKIETKSHSPTCSKPTKKGNTLNNAEYIPYSKLTLGGVRVSDIEKELSDDSNKNDVMLSPILDKILNREDSFHNDSPRVDTLKKSPKILTTSDENLLREVLDIEAKVNKTLSKNVNEINQLPSNLLPKNDQLSHDNDDKDSYVDDFEDDKSDNSVSSAKDNSGDAHSKEKTNNSSEDNNDNKSLKMKKKNEQNKTFTKTLNLSLKNKIDIFEFVHSINTQEAGTQSNRTQQISLKETQTSPRNDKQNMQPIHNDLWPSIDPKGEVEKLFKVEKELIRQLIVDEYGDLLEKNINKPSTSKENHTNHEKNVIASQKNTQTSPAHAKSVMTSPTRTKTRTTSPIAMSLTFDKQTSPMMFEELKINVDDSDDLAISINLSSPRFSLRLPQTCHEVLSNLESQGQSKHKQTENIKRESRVFKRSTFSSSSSGDGDYSSSDISSLGEVRVKLQNKLRKLRIPSISEFSSSTSLSKCSSDLSSAVFPLRSEGEVSLGQVARRNTQKHHKCVSEMSLGRLY